MRGEGLIHTVSMPRSSWIRWRSLMAVLSLMSLLMCVVTWLIFSVASLVLW